MCGIAGAYHLKRGSLDPVCMLEAAHVIRHRGPDGEGYLLLNTASGEHSLRNGPDTPANIIHPLVTDPVEFAPDLIFAHRRLAIIDVSPGGHEPMTVEDGTLWITFNGEIYNYLELRDELKAKGYQFHTESDVEVLLQAYREWDIHCLDRFVGMFAFALWDQRKQRLWCVRDRFGIKPFYYANTGTTFAFSSEIKALKPLVPEACRPDMTQFFWFLSVGGNYNAPYTFFEGVRELPGGHYLLIEGGVAQTPVQWWDVDLERARNTYNYNDPEGEFLRLMRDAVRLRLRSDVPVGTCLSGGLDSSTIVALATEQLNGGRINSFSSLYPVKGLDETRYVDIVAQRYHTIEHRITPEPTDFLKLNERITWHQDMPTSGPSVFSQHFVMKLAHGNVTVLLDGQGSDELFAGYLTYVVFQLNQLRRQNPTRWVGEQIRFMLESWQRFHPAFTPRELAYRVYQKARDGGRGAPSPITPDVERIGQQRQAEKMQVQLAGAEPLNNFLYQTVMRDSIPALLHYEDRNSMAYSIEARVPFLDHRLVEFALGVPADLKVRGPETKWFMRKALQGVLPDEVVNRKDKLGYPTPFANWLRGSLRQEVESYLFDQVLKREWYNAAQVKQIWQEHVSGVRNYNALIYRMIAAEQWYQRFSA